MESVKFKVGDIVVMQSESPVDSAENPGYVSSMYGHIGKLGIVTNVLENNCYAVRGDDGCKWTWHRNWLRLFRSGNLETVADPEIVQTDCLMDEADHYFGKKADKGKLQFSLLTRGLALPLKAIAAVLTYGAQKYAAESWQTVPDAKRRYEDALDRHLSAWREGIKYDEESGLPHIAHAACNILFLLWFEIKEHALNITDFNEVHK